MPNIYKVMLVDENINITDEVATFLAENCPAHGQLGEGGAFYVNAEVMTDLKRELLDLKYAKNIIPIMRALEQLDKRVKKEGLFEFMLA